MTRPTFVIAGAPRCATTWAFRALALHPDVVVSRSKEVHFFDRHFDRGPAWYEQQFPAATGNQVVGEATPGYVTDPVALERMLRFLPDVRVVILLRDPAERAWSQYWLNRQIGLEDLGFADALEAESARRAAHDGGRGWYAYAGRGRYAEQIRPLVALGPQLLVRTTDDLRANPDRLYRDVCSFVGAEPRPVPALADANRPVVWRTPRARRIVKAIPVRVLRRSAAHLLTSPVRPGPLAPESRQRIIASVADDVQELSAVLQRDLSHWLAD